MFRYSSIKITIGSFQTVFERKILLSVSDGRIIYMSFFDVLNQI